MIPLLLVAAGVVCAVEKIDAALKEPERKPCTDALDSMISAESLEPWLASFTVGKAVEPQPQDTLIRWEASLSRVMLRKCVAADTYGVEVAARWRAVESGTGSVRFDALLVHAPRSPAYDKRTPHPWDRSSALPPWEISVPPTSPCRPLAEYCAPGGSDIVLQDVVDGLQDMRSWLARQGAQSDAPNASGLAIAAPSR